MKLIKLWDADLNKAYELQNSFEANENGFTNSAVGYSLEEFKEYVMKKEGYSKGIGLLDGYVPETTFILVNEDNQYVGIFNLRHYLTETLANGAGHIGYGIKKEYRNNGYASMGLKMMIEIASKTIVEDEIYLSVHKDNPASLHVQMKNGAYIHHEDDNEYYTRIKKGRKNYYE